MWFAAMKIRDIAVTAILNRRAVSIAAGLVAAHTVSNYGPRARGDFRPRRSLKSMDVGNIRIFAVHWSCGTRGRQSVREDVAHWDERYRKTSPRTMSSDLRKQTRFTDDKRSLQASYIEAPRFCMKETQVL